MIKTKTLIVGAGISGLHTAYELEKSSDDFIIIESRKRTGGRISSYSDNNDIQFDLGPTWFWPEQKRIHNLINELKLEDKIFLQYSEGKGVYEDARGNITSGVNYVSMKGSLRLDGSLTEITKNLFEKIPKAKSLLSTKLIKVEHTQNSISAHCVNEQEKISIECEKIVLALPPRIICSSITFDSELPLKISQQFNNIPTWMAGHAKLVIVYEKPFWRELGFSGDVLSLQGPLGEIHDASTKDRDDHALFGFLNIEAEQRKVIGKDKIVQLSIEQLTRLYGKKAATPKEVFYKDWSLDHHTATKDDNKLAIAHPDFKIKPSLNQNIIWSGSETASIGQAMNGYIEGALEASWRTIGLLT